MTARKRSRRKKSVRFPFSRSFFNLVEKEVSKYLKKNLNNLRVSVNLIDMAY